MSLDTAQQVSPVKFYWLLCASPMHVLTFFRMGGVLSKEYAWDISNAILLISSITVMFLLKICTGLRLVHASQTRPCLDDSYLCFFTCFVPLLVCVILYILLI